MYQLQNPNIYPEDYLVPASTGKRFLHYIVDYIVFFIIVLGSSFLFGVILALTGNAEFWDYSYDDDDPMFALLDRIITTIIYAITMGLLEGFTRGRTVAKFFTNTVAVNEDGSRISFRQGFLRGLIKGVPFVQFSALGNPCNPWQDRWTETKVIDIKLTKERMSQAELYEIGVVESETISEI